MGWKDSLTERRKNRKRFGFCIECGEPCEDSTRCTIHKKSHAESQSRYRKNHPSSQEKANNAVANLKRKRLQNHECKDCGVKITKYTLCSKCRKKASERSKLWRERKSNEHNGKFENATGINVPTS